MQGRERLQRGIQVGAPDVAAVDHADRQHAILRPVGQKCVELIRAAHQVQMHAGHRQIAQQCSMRAHLVEVSREQQGWRNRRQRRIGRRECIAPRVVQIERENRLVDLYPFDAGSLQAFENPLITGQHAWQQVELMRQTGFYFAEIQQAQRPQQHRLDTVALRTRFHDFVEQPVDAAVERQIGRPFRHQVVIIGVEPFGHFHRKVRAAAARQRAVLRQAQLARIELEARRRRAQQRQRIQDLVVPREVADRDVIHPGLRLVRPVPRPQRLAGLLQCRLVACAAPERFERKFQFAMRPDAGETQGVCACHAMLLKSNFELVMVAHPGL